MIITIEMTAKTLLIILTSSILNFAHGQSPQVKQEIKIVSKYDYNYYESGKSYLSKEVQNIKIDTTIIEYKRDGFWKNPFPISGGRILSGMLCRDSTILISNKNNVKHEREYWSDTTMIDVFTHNYGDSIIQTKISDKDTIQVNKSFFKRGRLIKIHNQDFRPTYGNYNKVIEYHKKSKCRDASTVVTSEYKNGLTDTVRVVHNKWRRLHKKLAYNPDKQEWFVKEKTKYSRAKRVLWETFYHDYLGGYFTTKTTTVYNDWGLPISEIKYDTHLKHIESKTIHEYEYY